MYPTIILRHKKENLKKCSLRGLESREDIHFFSYPLQERLPDVSSYFLLSMGAPEISEKDKNKGILLLDGTWKYAEKMQKILDPLNITKRSLPKNYETAYPRKQTHCPDPKTGLASIEALYIALKLLGKDCSDLLDHYFWKEQFLSKNFP